LTGLSKANYFLENMLDLADTPLDDRLVQNLMSEPENDGGQWGKTASFLSNER
jgi:bleomycin hydrolase